MARATRSGGYSLRAASATIPFWIGAAVLLVVVVTPIVRGDWRLLAFVLPLCLLLAWILWMVLYRPSVRWDAQRAVVTNIGRSHVLPWSRVAAVRQSLNVDFQLEDGGSVKAWGSPMPRRTGNVLSNFDRRNRPTDDYHRNADILDAAREAAAPSDEPVVHRWDVVPLVIGAVLAVLVVLEFTIGI